jgi:TIR domain-containing protein
MGEGEKDAGEPRYTAFLSYSHKDSAAAARLHRRLEAYRLPKRLVGTETARGPVPERLWPIFRDRDELPAATDLSETVKQALARSGALIILCSPHAAASLWVEEEIEVFRRLHPDRPILAAVIEADPPDCFPAALRAFGRDGTWHEPLATDLRRHCDGPHLGLLKLVAGITGIGLDALVQRDAARRVRRVTAFTAAAFVAMLVMAALALFAFDARREAERQRAEAEGQIEFMLTDLRQRLKGVGRLDIMTAVNRRALAYYGRQGLGDLGPESLERRARILIAMGEDDLDRERSAQALAAFREAHRTTAEQLARAPNDPGRLLAHAQSEYWVGYVDYRRRNFGPARQAWQRYKMLADQLLAIDPNNADWLRESAYAEGNLCTIALAGRPDLRAAFRTCGTALGRMERVRQLRGDEAAIVADLANRHAWAADVWNAAGRWDRVLVHRRQQDALVGSLISRDPANLDYREIWMLNQLTFGRLLAGRGDRAEARRRLAEAAATAAMLRARDPDNASWDTYQQQIAEAMRRAGGP